MPGLGEMLSLGCALAWGVSVILFKQSEKASPQAINLFKNVGGTLLLGVTLLAVGGRFPPDRSWQDWARLVASGVLGLAVADTLFLDSLRRLGAGMMAILDCVYAPMVALLSVLFLGERLGLGFAVGSALVVFGLLAATTTGEGLRKAASTAKEHTGALFLGILSIAIMALGVVLAKPVLDRSELVEVTFTRLAVGSISLAIYILFQRDRRETFRVFVPQRVWRHLVPAMFLGCYVSMLLWLGGVKYTSASTASVLNQLSVLFTLILARVILKEPMTLRRMVGGGCSLAGAMVILLASTPTGIQVVERLTGP